ncbi:MAG: hypothetical protein JNK78_15475 [Planctomycetes bacterium]|nr:hypothetical protein [Planctomycetota bacterium]
MNLRSLPPLFGVAVCTIAASLPAQIHPVRCIVLVRAGASDVVLNAPLVVSLLDEDKSRERLTHVFGEAPTNVTWKVELSTGQPPGTFQIHVETTAYVGATWTPTLEQAVNSAVHAHLEARLERLLYSEPRERWLAQQDELVTRLTRASAQQKELAARSAAAERETASVARALEFLDQQFTAARVDAATEEAALAQLEQLQMTHARRRDQLREQLQHADAVRQDHEIQLSALSRQADAAARDPSIDRARRDALQDELRKLQADAQMQRAVQERAQEQLQDAQRMLSVVLEQQPTTALAAHRARARMQSLAEEQKRLEQRRVEVEQRAQRAGDDAIAAERLGSEIAACEAQLTIVRGRLAQLEPVRCELLGSR